MHVENDERGVVRVRLEVFVANFDNIVFATVPSG
jgi:hypothetical protein